MMLKDRSIRAIRAQSRESPDDLKDLHRRSKPSTVQTLTNSSMNIQTKIAICCVMLDALRSRHSHALLINAPAEDVALLGPLANGGRPGLDSSASPRASTFHRPRGSCGEQRPYATLPYAGQVLAAMWSLGRRIRAPLSLKTPRAVWVTDLLESWRSPERGDAGATRGRARRGPRRGEAERSGGGDAARLD